MSLHSLIQSMSKSEKRYFKLYAQIGKKSAPKYLQLFDLINKQKTYDEQVIKKKGFSSVDKNLLMEKLLDTVHIMQLHKSVDAELHLTLDYLPILYAKKHWQLLGKYIKKAKQIARDNERFEALLEILRWERNFIFKTVKNDFYEKIDKLQKEKKKVLRLLEDELEYGYLSTQIDAITVSDATLSKPQTQELFEQFANSPLLQSWTKPLSKRATVEYYYTKYMHHRLKGDKEICHESLLSLVNLFNENEFLLDIRGYAGFYVKAFFWEKSLAIQLNKQSNTKIAEYVNNLSDASIDIPYNFHLQNLTFCIRSLNQDEGKQLIVQAEERWTYYTKHLKETRLSVFSYTVMVFYCLFEDWENAQIWLNKVTAVHRVTDRKDVQIASRLWQLMIGYEIAPYDLDKHIQSAYKYFVRNEHYFEVEQQVLQIFRNLYKAITRDEKKAVWQEMSDFIGEKIKEKDVPQRGLINLHIWCQSKIAGISNVEVIRQRRKEAPLMYV